MGNSWETAVHTFTDGKRKKREGGAEMKGGKKKSWKET